MCECGTYRSRDDIYFTDVFWNDYTGALGRAGLAFELPNIFIEPFLLNNEVLLPAQVLNQWITRFSPDSVSDVILYDVENGPDDLYFQYNEKAYMVEVVRNQISVGGPLSGDHYGLASFIRYFGRIPHIDSALAAEIFTEHGPETTITGKVFSEIFSGFPFKLLEEEFFSFLAKDVENLKEMAAHCLKMQEQVIYLQC